MRSRAIAVVAVVVAAFLLVTTPVVSDAASGLSKQVVKKISKKAADKEIAKKGPGLSVSHAGTSDNAKTAGTATTAMSAQNATTLAGQAAGSYLTTAYRYALPIKPAAPTVKYRFPSLPAGSYLVNYSTRLDIDSGSGPVDCYISPDSSGTRVVADNYGLVVGDGTTVSASASITNVAAGAPFFECIDTSGNISTASANFDSSVTFTRLDTVTSTNAG